MLLDTTSFIDLQRGHEPARDAFKKDLVGQSTSVITKLELIKGSPNKKAMRETLVMLTDMRIQILTITPLVTKVAERIMENYHHSSGMGIRDSFIAATAIIFEEELATHNTKHFNFIPNLKLIKPY